MEIGNHVVVVTGGASGLGEACVRALVKRGAKVAVLDLDEDRGRGLSSEQGPSVIFCKTDIADENTVQAAFDNVVDAFGAVHATIHCAGISPAAKILGKKGLMPLDHFRKVVDVNLTGTLNIMRYAVERMVRNNPTEDGERGVIINTASTAAFEGQIGQAAYSASKAGVVGMTLPAAREFADYGVRVVTIAPGLFETPMSGGLPEKVKQSLISMIPFPRRFGKPEEFAMAAAQIIENPVINGTTIRLDGALRMAGK